MAGANHPSAGSSTMTGDAFDSATQPKRPEMSLGELFSELTSGLGTLIHQEIELAKTEAKAEATLAGKVGAMFGVAGLAGFFTLMMLSLALAWLLDQAMNTALSFALVGLLWGVVAAVLVVSARKKAKDIKALPTTTQTLKEDVQWAKTQKS